MSALYIYLKQNKEAQVVIISLWILIILTILAVSIGHRVSMALRLTRYQRDRLKALYLAKAGVNQAILELENDLSNPNTKDYDSLNETWSTGMDDKKNLIFENIEIKEGSGETFTVSIKDEQAKININRIDIIGQKQVLEIFRFAGLEESEAEKLKNIVVDWIDTDPETEPEKEDFKNQPLKTPEELLVILEYFYEQSSKDKKESQEKTQEIYDKVKDLITVWGDGKVNINTAAPEILEILIKACITKLKDAGTTVNALPGELLSKILQYRENNAFLDINLENVLDLSGPNESDFKNIINELKNLIDVKSQNFRIIATGEITHGNLARKINCVFNRTGTDKKIVYWHES